MSQLTRAVEEKNAQHQTALAQVQEKQAEYSQQSQKADAAALAHKQARSNKDAAAQDVSTKAAELAEKTARYNEVLAQAHKKEEARLAMEHAKQALAAAQDVYARQSSYVDATQRTFDNAIKTFTEARDSYKKVLIAYLVQQGMSKLEIGMRTKALEHDGFLQVKDALHTQRGAHAKAAHADGAKEANNPTHADNTAAKRDYANPQATSARHIKPRARHALQSAAAPAATNSQLKARFDMLLARIEKRTAEDLQA